MPRRRVADVEAAHEEPLLPDHRPQAERHDRVYQMIDAFGMQGPTVRLELGRQEYRVATANLGGRVPRTRARAAQGSEGAFFPVQVPPPEGPPFLKGERRHRLTSAAAAPAAPAS